MHVSAVWPCSCSWHPVYIMAMFSSRRPSTKIQAHKTRRDTTHHTSKDARFLLLLRYSCVVVVVVVVVAVAAAVGDGDAGHVKHAGTSMTRTTTQLTTRMRIGK